MIPTIAFLQSMGGVGTTSLVYHLAWMYSDLGYSVLAVDLDPQACLTAAMVDHEQLRALWSDDHRGTLYGAIRPLVDESGDVSDPHRERIGDKLELLVGDLAISRFEDELSHQWARCLDGQERAFRVITSLHRCIQAAAHSAGADIVLIDLGPYLGAINRAALVASQHIVVPVSPDLFSVQGLSDLGPTVRQWREEWGERIPKNPVPKLASEKDVMQPAGYVVLQHSVRLDRPVQAGELWMKRIPETYAKYVLDQPPEAKHPSEDPQCLGLLKRYGSLMPMAQEARKPIFHLKPADGALGAHAAAARDARGDFKTVAKRIAQATWRAESGPSD
jgi:cellulose biosynthesis protein BcsQ